MAQTRLDTIAPRVSDALDRLDDKARRAFAASLCHRQRPFYADFSEEHEFGDPDVFADTVDLLMDAGPETRAEDVAKLLRRCREAAPDSDEWRTYKAHAAQQTISVCYGVLKWLSSGDLRYLKDAAEYAIDNADYIDEYSNELDQQYEIVDPNVIPDRPLAGQERGRQLRDTTHLLDDRVAAAARSAAVRRYWAAERVDVLESSVQ